MSQQRFIFRNKQVSVFIASQSVRPSAVSVKYRYVSKRLHRQHFCDLIGPSFLPRNAMRKRGLCCRPVSVCLRFSSDADIVRLTNARIIIPNSEGNSFTGDAKYTRGGKNVRFSTEVKVYLGNGTR